MIWKSLTITGFPFFKKKFTGLNVAIPTNSWSSDCSDTDTQIRIYLRTEIKPQSPRMRRCFVACNCVRNLGEGCRQKRNNGRLKGGKMKPSFFSKRLEVGRKQWPIMSEMSYKSQLEEREKQMQWEKATRAEGEFWSVIEIYRQCRGKQPIWIKYVRLAFILTGTLL